MKAPYTCDLKALFALHLLKWFSSENVQAMLLWVMGNKWWVLYRNNASQTVEQGKERLSRAAKSQVRVTVQNRDILFSWLDQHFDYCCLHLWGNTRLFQRKISNMLETQQSRFLQKIFDRQWSFLESLKVIISSRKKIEFYKILLCLFLV